ncbi:hypothetical protein V6N13_143007 [Hibiscus sabdariffa]|uniref:Uncharacterized protein n=1 Tax=Hibiscus sabdariffa TaxID=183260 RepID=A0ABR2FFY0_9ROSI
MEHREVPVQNNDKQILLHGSSSAGKGSSVGEHVRVGRCEVASSKVVVHVRVSLDPKAHVVVHVVEPGKDLEPLTSSGHRASVGVGLSNLKSTMRLQVGKGGNMKGDQARKKASGHTPSKVQLGEWIRGLETELSHSGGEKVVSALAGDNSQRKPDANV